MSNRVSPEHRSTPFDGWPRQDRAVWDDATRPGTALFDAGRGAHWSAATRRRYRWAYGHWLTFLQYSDRLNQDVAPGDRITPDAIEAFIASFRRRDLASSTVASYLEALHNALWGMCPDRDWHWLRDFVDYLRRHAIPRKNAASRIWPIDEVYQKGLDLMDHAERMTPKRPLQDSIWFRDGLMVAMLAACVLRRRNFARLEIGRHITRQSDDWLIAVAAEEVKNKLAIEGLLPSSLTSCIDRYVSYHRPRLLRGRAHAALWVVQAGRPFTVDTLSRRITKVTKRLGCPMSPHLFRHSAATTIATTAPELATMIGPFLGHRCHHTSEVHYNKAKMIDSSRRHCDTIAELRAALRGLAEREPAGAA